MRDLRQIIEANKEQSKQRASEAFIEGKLSRSDSVVIGLEHIIEPKGVFGKVPFTGEDLEKGGYK